MWDVNRAGVALQEGFQPNRLLRRHLRGVTLGMVGLIPHLHLYLYSALHPRGAAWLSYRGGGSVGLAGVQGCGRDPPPSPGRRRAGFVLAWLRCRWERAALWLWALHLLGTSLVPDSPRMLLVMRPWGGRKEVPGT